jgi:hypothetical protein
MTIKASGSLSFSEISQEHGLPPRRNLGAYRMSKNIGSLTNLPLATGIPQSGEIKFSDFYNTRLNTVILTYTSYTGINARTSYNNRTFVQTVGGFISAPSNSSGKKVIINVNGTVASVNSTIRRECAFNAGNWDADTTLQMVVASYGSIIGRGGVGGDGEQGGKRNAENGTSALQIEYPITITNNGTIQTGYGGGGGGGAALSETGGKKNRRTWTAAGGGGGGGAGFYGGNGGNGGGGAFSNGSRGSNGSTTVRGAGGGGGNHGGNAVGGSGGNGGDRNANPQNGDNGSGNRYSGRRGDAGNNGYGVILVNGSSYSISGNPIYGDVTTG